MSDEPTESSEVLGPYLRPTRCPACKEAFNFQYRISKADLDSKPLWVDMACEWCHAELSVDVSQYRPLVIHKQAIPTGPAAAIAFDLPDEVAAELRVRSR